MIAPATTTAAGVKRCSKCGIHKDESQFYTQTSPSGKPYRRGECKLCHKASARRRKGITGGRKSNPNRAPLRKNGRPAMCECGNTYTRRWRDDATGCPTCRELLNRASREIDELILAQRQERFAIAIDPLKQCVGRRLNEEVAAGYADFWRRRGMEPPEVSQTTVHLADGCFTLVAGAGVRYG